MFWKILSAALAAALILFFIWALRGALLMPVRLGKRSALCLCLRVTGAEPALEETLDGLLWLRENGTLRGEIVLEDAGMDEETRQIAALAARRHACVSLRGAETEETEETEAWEKRTDT